jgi:hypothetical protein
MTQAVGGSRCTSWRRLGSHARWVAVYPASCLGLPTASLAAVWVPLEGRPRCAELAHAGSRHGRHHRHRTQRGINRNPRRSRRCCRLIHLRRGGEWKRHRQRRAARHRRERGWRWAVTLPSSCPGLPSTAFTAPGVPLVGRPHCAELAHAWSRRWVGLSKWRHHGHLPRDRGDRRRHGHGATHSRERVCLHRRLRCPRRKARLTPTCGDGLLMAGLAAVGVDDPSIVDSGARLTKLAHARGWAWSRRDEGGRCAESRLEPHGGLGSSSLGGRVACLAAVQLRTPPWSHFAVRAHVARSRHRRHPLRRRSTHEPSGETLDGLLGCDLYPRLPANRPSQSNLKVAHGGSEGGPGIMLGGN